MLISEDLHRVYRLQGTEVNALRGVSLSLQPAEFLAITGPSGSGKSTLLHLLGGVDIPTRGRVRLAGQDLGSLTETQRARFRLETVGLVFQRFHLLPMLSAAENVELPMAEAGAGRGERRDRARLLLERVSLSDRRNHKPGQLSGGQRQRVAIARALANRPRLLLADEPTGELDRSTSEEILDLFQSLNAEGTTIVVATHDLALAEGANRQVAIVDGQLRGPGSGGR
jgi:putative ABC transport system ATP-binding protein